MDFETFKAIRAVIHGKPTMRFLFREGDEKFYLNCRCWEEAWFLVRSCNVVLIEKV